ncbi:MAG: hypothetical protein AABY22_36445 [Nanoarchaeota archaeon]
MSEIKLYTFNEILEFFLVHKVISEQQMKQIIVRYEGHMGHACIIEKIMSEKFTDVKWAKEFTMDSQIPELKNYQRIWIPKEPVSKKIFRDIDID